jgi:ABC-type nickel/cobalt efflux system permease component RcnA
VDSGVVFGFSITVLFGVWWIVAPSTVNRLYRWLHGSKFEDAKPWAIRVAGVAVIMVAFLIFFGWLH